MISHVNIKSVQKKSKKGILLGFLILLLQIGMLVAYGLTSNFLYIPTNNFSVIEQQGLLVIYFFMTLFVVGMGLMVSYFREGITLGLGIAILTLCVNIQLCPLFQKLWYSIFIGSFNQSTSSSTNDLFSSIQQLKDVRMSIYLQRNSVAMTISFMVSMVGTIGRMGIWEWFVAVLVYNVAWPIPFYINIKLFLGDGPASKQSFDDFGLTYIYAFAAFFGIVYSIFLNFRKQKKFKYAFPTRQSSILSIFGSTIVFCTLPSTGLLYPISSVNQNSSMYNIGMLNIYFSQIGCIISCVIFSLILGKGKLHFQQFITCVLSGPIIVAQLATVQTQIVLFLILGAIAGIINSFWNQILYTKINRNSVQDSMGIVGAVLLPSLFGAVAFMPIMYKIYIMTGWRTLKGVYTDQDYIKYNFIYYFITAGVGFVAAIIAGIFSFCTRQLKQYDFRHTTMFSPNFGLCNNPLTYESSKTKIEGTNNQMQNSRVQYKQKQVVIDNKNIGITLKKTMNKNVSIQSGSASHMMQRSLQNQSQNNEHQG